MSNIQIQEEFSNLVALTKRYIQQEHDLKDWHISDLATCQDYRNYAKQSGYKGVRPQQAQQKPLQQQPQQAAQAPMVQPRPIPQKAPPKPVVQRQKPAAQPKPKPKEVPVDDFSDFRQMFAQKS